MTTVRDIIEQDAARWRAATRHPFLDGARTGALHRPAFDRWLEQDRGFVAALAEAWRIMRAGAPTDDLTLLDSGIAAFDEEVAWFDALATELGLTSDAPALAAAAAYRADLLALAARPYPTAIAAMWAVEAAYLEAWRSALPGAAEYRPFVEHWTGAEFAAFVGQVEDAANRALDQAPPDAVAAARDAISLVARHEAAFWAMTWSG